jgi:hypothetical protein
VVDRNEVERVAIRGLDRNRCQAGQVVNIFGDRNTDMVSFTVRGR